MEMDDAGAVARVRSGEKDAFRLLVERHSPIIFRLAFRMMENEHDAEEIVQDTFLRAYRALDSFESRVNFGTWLYRIALNRCYDDPLLQRKARPQVLAQEDPDQEAIVDQVAAKTPSPERNVLSSEIKTKVHFAVEQFPVRLRIAFILRHFEGQSHENVIGTPRMRPNVSPPSECHLRRGSRKAYHQGKVKSICYRASERPKSGDYLSHRRGVLFPE